MGDWVTGWTVARAETPNFVRNTAPCAAPGTQIPEPGAILPAGGGHPYREAAFLYCRMDRGMNTARMIATQMRVYRMG